MDNTIKLAGNLVKNAFNRIQQLREQTNNTEIDQAYYESQVILLNEANQFCTSVTDEISAETKSLLDTKK